MNYVEKRLNKKTDDISFIQIKKESSLGSDLDLTDIPLPILTNSLIKEIQDKEAEEIEMKKVIEAMIFLLGVADTEFPYIDEYKEILKKSSPDIEENIFFKAMESFKEEDIDNSLINIRALLSLNPNSIKGLFQYGILLESIGKDLLEEEKVEEGEELLKLSTFNFEKILDVDDEYALAYYKLGYHYRYLSQYIKANLIWEKFLKFSSDDLLKQEVRGELDLIKDEVNFETAITYISYSEFQKALDSLLKLLPMHEESWNVNYLIAQCYNGIGEIELAIEYFNKAIQYNPEELELYNELGIIYYNMGDIVNAIEIFTEGIEQPVEDYKLIFNRSLMYSALNEYDKALEDAEKAYELNPDDNIKTQIQWLKEEISI